MLAASGRLHYFRHFALLACIAAGILAVRWRFGLGAATWFACPIGDLAATSSACALAALGVLWVVGHSPVRGAQWVTIAWWFTFSAGLWYHEPR
jgi:hypothetical protein